MIRVLPKLVLALLLVSAPVLTACGGGGGGGEEGPPPLAFFIATSSPSEGAIRVPLDATIYVTFNKAFQPESVTTNTLTLRTADGAFIAGATSILSSSSNLTLRFTTIQNLAATEVHVCTVDESLRSIDDEPLEGTHTVSFTAIDPNEGVDLPDPSQLRATVGMLNNGRDTHRATLLDDGRVLITGGFSQGAVATASAEVFISGTETFQNLTNSMRHARAGHTATLLTDGRVLITGGWYRTDGGQTDVRQTAEVFDPTDNSFAFITGMTEPRADHAAVRLPNGTVLITGGSALENGFLVDLDTAEIFNPTTNTFAPAANLMNTFRAQHCAIMRADATVVLAGGSISDFRPEEYDFFGGAFTSMNQAASDARRFGAACAQFESGAVAVAGGEVLGTVLHINTANFVQNTGSGLSRPRSYATATRIKRDQILVAGGIDFSNGSFIESSCDLLIEGGFGGSNTFPTQVRFSTGMAFHTATILATGDILFCGGRNENGALPNKRNAFIFDVE